MSDAKVAKWFGMAKSDHNLRVSKPTREDSSDASSDDEDSKPALSKEELIEAAEAAEAAARAAADAVMCTPGADGSSSSSSSSVCAPVPLFAKPLTPEETWPVDDEYTKYVSKPQRLEQFGVGNLRIEPVLYNIDTMPAETDAEKDAIVQLALEMNGGAGAVWYAPFEADGKEARRYHARFPVPVQPVPTDADVKRVVLEFGLPAESLSSDTVYNTFKPTRSDSMHNGRSLYLSLDSNITKAQLKSKLGNSDFDTRKYHVTPLSVRAVKVVNNTPTSMRMCVETLNTRYEDGKAGSSRYMPICLPIGLCNPTDVQLARQDHKTDGTESGQLVATMPAEHSGPLQDELSNLYRLHGQDEYNNPDVQRWINVDCEPAIREAVQQYGYSDGKNAPRVLHFDVPESERDVVLPRTLAEFVLFSHGHELRLASEMLETQRKATKSSDEKIRAPREIEVGRKDPVKKWCVNIAAFEMTMRYLCCLHDPAEFSVNLNAPLRLAITPRTGNLGWIEFKTAGKPNVRMDVLVEMIFVTHHGSQRMDKAEHERLVAPVLVDHAQTINSTRSSINAAVLAAHKHATNKMASDRRSMETEFSAAPKKR